MSGYDQYKEAWDTGYWSSVPMGGKQARAHPVDCAGVLGSVGPPDQESVHFFHTYKQKAGGMKIKSVGVGRLGACRRADFARWTMSLRTTLPSWSASTA